MIETSIINPFEVKPQKIIKKGDPLIGTLKLWKKTRNDIEKGKIRIWKNFYHNTYDYIIYKGNFSVGPLECGRIFRIVRNRVWLSLGWAIDFGTMEGCHPYRVSETRNSVWDFYAVYCSKFLKLDIPCDLTPFIIMWECGLIPIFIGDYWLVMSRDGIKWEGEI